MLAMQVKTKTILGEAAYNALFQVGPANLRPTNSFVPNWPNSASSRDRWWARPFPEERVRKTAPKPTWIQSCAATPRNLWCLGGTL